MEINSKIAKIPFFILYLILAVFTSYNWIRVILFQSNFEVFRSTQPWDYYLSNSFADTFGITQQQYFIFAFPIVLIGLCLIPKIVGKFMGLDKNSNVKGDNHVAIILILLTAPSILGLQTILGADWRGHLLPGILLVGIFSLFSWADEQKTKRKA